MQVSSIPAGSTSYNVTVAQAFTKLLGVFFKYALFGCATTEIRNCLTNMITYKKGQSQYEKLQRSLPPE